MTTAQIEDFRKRIDAFTKDIAERASKDKKPANLDLTQPTFTLLGEIAYQIAVANERNTPRWVKFDRGDGIAYYVDANKIRSVQQYAERVGGKEATVIEDDWLKEHMIYEPMADVLAKLKINPAAK